MFLSAFFFQIDHGNARDRCPTLSYILLISTHWRLVKNVYLTKVHLTEKDFFVEKIYWIILNFKWGKVSRGVTNLVLCPEHIYLGLWQDFLFTVRAALNRLCSLAPDSWCHLAGFSIRWIWSIDPTLYQCWDDVGDADSTLTSKARVWKRRNWERSRFL